MVSTNNLDSYQILNSLRSINISDCSPLAPHVTLNQALKLKTSANSIFTLFFLIDNWSLITKFTYCLFTPQYLNHLHTLLSKNFDHLNFLLNLFLNSKIKKLILTSSFRIFNF